MPNMGTGRKAGASKSIGLADALFSATQQRVLALLFGQSEQSFIQQELIDRAESGSGAVRRELDRLVGSGLVTVQRIGTQKHYQANRAAPVFDELRAIVMKTVALTDPLRAALRPLAKRIGLALVHGSVARGEDRAQSDIDLLIVADDLSLEDLFARLAPVERKLGRKIHPTLYTSQEFVHRRSSGQPFLKKVLAGEQMILIGSIDRVSESR
jgi:predicted nucleotidyltransferase